MKRPIERVFGPEDGSGDYFFLFFPVGFIFNIHSLEGLETKVSFSPNQAICKSQVVLKNLSTVAARKSLPWRSMLPSCASMVSQKQSVLALSTKNTERLFGLVSCLSPDNLLEQRSALRKHWMGRSPSLRFQRGVFGLFFLEVDMRS